jgi:hypothetical protein
VRIAHRNVGAAPGVPGSGLSRLTFVVVIVNSASLQLLDGLDQGKAADEHGGRRKERN